MSKLCFDGECGGAIPDTEKYCEECRSYLVPCHNQEYGCDNLLMVDGFCDECHQFYEYGMKLARRELQNNPVIFPDERETWEKELFELNSEEVYDRYATIYDNSKEK